MSKKKHKKNNGKPSYAPQVNEAPVEEVIKPESEEAKTEEVKATEAKTEEAKAENTAEEAVDLTEFTTKRGKKRERGVEITKITVIGEETRQEAKRAGENLMKALDEALDENAEDLEHPESGALQTAKKLSLRRLAVSAFGFFMTVFAVVGIIASVSYIADYMSSNSDDSLLREEFLLAVAPLTASDSSTFEDPQAVSEDMLITCACWDIILNPEEHKQQNGYYIVSEFDIDKHIASLFGSGLSYTHKTVGDVDLRFILHESSGMYEIPAYPQSPAYIPKISSYTAIDGGYKLEVEYYQPITEIVKGDATAEKIMIYTLKENGEEYIITSLEISQLITGGEL